MSLNLKQKCNLSDRMPKEGKKRLKEEHKNTSQKRICLNVLNAVRQVLRLGKKDIHCLLVSLVQARQ